MPKYNQAISKKCGRARLTNKPLALPGIDGRSPWARRRRDLIREFSEQLGRTPDTRERVLISNAATLTVRCEQLQCRVVSGEDVDDEQLVRLSNMAGRLLAILHSGNERSKKSKTTSARPQHHPE